MKAQGGVSWPQEKIALKWVAFKTNYQQQQKTAVRLLAVWGLHHASC